MKEAPASIGVISDTHGLLREQALEALRGSGLIIHAGDIGGPEIIEALEMLAPVVAVRGNTDQGDWADSLPETAVAEAGDALIYILHDIHALDLDPAACGFRMVVSGHSHKPGRADRAGVIYLNPGSAGPRRFQLPITLARIHPGDGCWGIDFIDLAGKASE
ncbi:MAG: metallophosphoesterase family protein [Candidatus Acidiferrales bacterium]|jgi:putative phosphoesterase